MLKTLDDYQKNIDKDKVLKILGSILGGFILIILIVDLFGGISVNKNNLAKDIEISLNASVSLDKAKIIFAPLPVLKITNLKIDGESLKMEGQTVKIKKSLSSIFNFKNSKLKKITLINSKLTFVKNNPNDSTLKFLDLFLVSAKLVKPTASYSVAFNNSDIIIKTDTGSTVFSNLNLTYHNTNMEYDIKGHFDYLNDKFRIDALVEKNSDPIKDTRNIQMDLTSSGLTINFHKATGIKNNIPQNQDVELNMSIFRPIQFLQYIFGNEAIFLLNFTDHETLKNPVKVRLKYSEDLINNTLSQQDGQIESSIISGNINISKKILDEQKLLGVEINFNKLDLSSFNKNTDSENTDPKAQTNEQKPQQPTQTTEVVQGYSTQENTRFFRFSDLFTPQPFLFKAYTENLKIKTSNFGVNIDIAKQDNKVLINELNLFIPNAFLLTGRGYIQDLNSNFPKTLLKIKSEGSSLQYLFNLIGDFGLSKLTELDKFKDFNLSVNAIIKQNSIILQDINLDFKDISTKITGRFQKNTSLENRNQEIVDIEISKLNLDELSLKDGVFNKKHNLLEAMLKISPNTSQSLNLICNLCIIKNKTIDKIGLITDYHEGALSVKSLFIRSKNTDINMSGTIDINSQIPLLNWTIEINKLIINKPFKHSDFIKKIQNGLYIPNLNKFAGLLIIKSNGVELPNYYIWGFQNILQINNGTIESQNIEINGSNKNNNTRIKILLSGSIGLNEVPSINISFSGQNMQSQGMVEFFTSKTGISGPISFTGRLQSSGETIEKIFQSVTGDGTFRINPAKITGLSIDNMTKYTLARSAKSLSKLNKQAIDGISFDSKKTLDFDKIEGAFLIGTNEILLSNVGISSHYTSVQTNGKYNFINQNFSLSARGVTAGLDLKAGLSKAFPLYFSFALSGNDKDEKINLATNLLQLYQYVEARKMYGK